MKEEFKDRKIVVSYTKGWDSAEFFDVDSEDYSFYYEVNDEFVHSSSYSNWDEERFKKAKIEIRKMMDCIVRIHELYFDKWNDEE